MVKILGYHQKINLIVKRAVDLTALFGAKTLPNKMRVHYYEQ